MVVRLGLLGLAKFFFERPRFIAHPFNKGGDIGGCGGGGGCGDSLFNGGSCTRRAL